MVARLVARPDSCPSTQNESHAGAAACRAHAAWQPVGISLGRRTGAASARAARSQAVLEDSRATAGSSWHQAGVRHRWGRREAQHQGRKRQVEGRAKSEAAPQRSHWGLRSRTRASAPKFGGRLAAAARSPRDSGAWAWRCAARRVAHRAQRRRGLCRRRPTAQRLVLLCKARGVVRCLDTQALESFREAQGRDKRGGEKRWVPHAARVRTRARLAAQRGPDERGCAGWTATCPKLGRVGEAVPGHRGAPWSYLRGGG